MKKPKQPAPSDFTIHPLWSAAKDHLDKISLIQSGLNELALLASESGSSKGTADMLSIMADSLDQAYYSLNNLLFRELQEKHAKGGAA